MGKPVEKVVAGHLHTFLNDTNSLDTFQLGFRPHHGTEAALVMLLEDPLQEANSRSVALLVLLDLSVAFDTVDHNILLDWLWG